MEVRGPEGTEILYEGRQVHDLLTLVNGVKAQVASAEIPAGRRDALRFVLAADEPGAHTVTVGGAVHVLPALAPGAYELQLWDGDQLLSSQGGVQVTSGELSFVDL